MWRRLKVIEAWALGYTKDLYIIEGIPKSVCCDCRSENSSIPFLQPFLHGVTTSFRHVKSVSNHLNVILYRSCYSCFDKYMICAGRELRYFGRFWEDGALTGGFFMECSVKTSIRNVISLIGKRFPWVAVIRWGFAVCFAYPTLQLNHASQTRSKDCHSCVRFLWAIYIRTCDTLNMHYSSGMHLYCRYMLYLWLHCTVQRICTLVLFIHFSRSDSSIQHFDYTNVG